MFVVSLRLILLIFKLALCFLYTFIHGVWNTNDIFMVMTMIGLRLIFPY